MPRCPDDDAAHGIAIPFAHWLADCERAAVRAISRLPPVPQARARWYFDPTKLTYRELATAAARESAHGLIDMKKSDMSKRDMNTKPNESSSVLRWKDVLKLVQRGNVARRRESRLPCTVQYERETGWPALPPGFPE